MGLYSWWGARETSKNLREGVVGCYSDILIADISPFFVQREEFVAFTVEALQLIEQTDPRRFARVQQQLRYVACYPAGSLPAYHKPSASFFFDFQKYLPLLTERGRDWYVAECASRMVYNATLGLIASRGIPYNRATWRRIQKLCAREQNQFIRRLRNDCYNFAGLIVQLERQQAQRLYSKWHWRNVKQIFVLLRRIVRRDET